jgi:hypothetical protein
MFLLFQVRLRNVVMVLHRSLMLYRKFGVHVEAPAYRTWRQENASRVNGLSDTLSPPQEAISPVQQPVEAAPPSPSATTGPPAPYPTSFAEVVELISSGKPVPGIKDIPDTVLNGQGSQSSAPKRKKPWEKEERSESAAKVMQET